MDGVELTADPGHLLHRGAPSEAENAFMHPSTPPAYTTSPRTTGPPPGAAPRSAFQATCPASGAAASGIAFVRSGLPPSVGQPPVSI